MASLPFQEYWKTAQSGDIMLVSGAKDLDSAMAKAIKAGTRSRFSHVGLIVRITDEASPWWADGMYGNLRAEGTEVQYKGDPTRIPPVPDTMRGGVWGAGDPIPKDRQVYVLDSDYEEDGTVDGPVLRPLQEVVEAYMADDYHGADGDVIVRRLVCDPSNPGHRAEIDEKILEVAREVRGREFEAKSMFGPEFLQMFLSTFSMNFSEDLTRLFCSECVGACYERCGLIPDGNASNYKPQDFAAAKLNALSGGASLGPEMRLGLEELSHGTRVRIVRAANLSQATCLDVPDPYCICKAAGRTKFETEPLKDTTDPAWDCTKEVMWNGTDDISFEVWDKNTLIWDNVIGQARLPDGAEVGLHERIDLERGDDKRGELTVEVEIVRRKLEALTTNGEQDPMYHEMGLRRQRKRGHKRAQERWHVLRCRVSPGGA